MPKTFILPLTHIVRETPEAFTLVMDQPLVDRIAYLPGQYLTLKIDLNGKPHYRSYSISSTPGLDRYLAVTVKRLPGGLVSNYIHDHFEPGRLIEFLKPAGHFTLEPATSHERHIALVGAGSGITPLMGILRALLYGEPRSRVRLLYGSRDAKHVIFRDRLKELQRQFPERLHVQHVLSQPQPGTTLPHLSGRIDRAMLEQWQAEGQLVQPIEGYYLCGPEGLMRLAKETFVAHGADPTSIFTERFVATEENTAAQQQIQGPTRWVELIIADRTHRIQVPPGLSILQAAMAQGLRLPYSCKRGICSTCMSKLLSGEIEMDNPESLLPFEIEAGKVLTCQARPLTDDVKILVGG